MNSLVGQSWPEGALSAQEVIVGKNTAICLRPHNGEFDFAAVLGGRFDYESEVFNFLDSHIQQYDAVVEIGANVGVFTLYLARQLETKGGAVYAFEPSSHAYSRLLENVRANALPNAILFNAAIGDTSGFQRFYEPEGHLTNGSLVPGFAEKFSNAVRSVPVLVIDAAKLSELLLAHSKVLIKIDVEGFEGPLLKALEPVIRAKRPDILLEVLPEFADAINEAAARTTPGYKFYGITPEGLRQQDMIKAIQGRDCFLSPTALL